MATDFDPAGLQRQHARHIGHPPGLWVLFITEMWERFSYYGMRALLVLYLVQSTGAFLPDGTANKNPGFGWSKEDASVLYGYYTGAVYLTPLIGGWLADRFLGTHRSMLVGGWIIAAGHITLATTELFGITAGNVVTLQTAPGALICFLTGLMLIIIGTGFFKPCVSVMVGQLYERGDPRRDSGFTIFYMGINLGALFSPLVAGTLGETVGWHWGFGSAAVGMLTGLFFYQTFRGKYLGDIGLSPNRTEHPAEEALPTDVDPGSAGRPVRGPSSHLRRVEWQRLAVILILAVVGNIFFWTAFEQAGSSMNIFAKEQTDRTLWGIFAEGGLLEGLFEDGRFPATWYQAVNPAAIILFAPFFSWLWVRLERRGANPSTPMKFSCGLYLLGLAFLAMVAGAFETRGGALAGPHWLLITYVVYTWGELCLSPVGLSMVTKLAPLRLQSLMMGVWFLSFAVANYLGGQVAAFSTKMDTSRHVVQLLPRHAERPAGHRAEKRVDVLLIEKERAQIFADVKIDSSTRELVVVLLKKDRATPLPIARRSIQFSAEIEANDGSPRRVRLSMAAKPQKSESGGKSSRFVVSLNRIPFTVESIENVSGTLSVTVNNHELQPRLAGRDYTFAFEGSLIHDHYTFVFPGLAGFYLLLVVVPLGAGLLITLLTPLLKRMMHGVQ